MSKYDYSVIPKPVKSFYSVVAKRVFDIFSSLLALIILSPLLLIVCILELIFHGRPVFYATRRPGKDGKIINIYKFRSMTNERDNEGHLLRPEKRLTKFGIFLRKTSIDELPELWSILKGDMSIIGPRPLLIEYLDMYCPRHAMRHAVRPGLACVRISREDMPNTWTWGDQFENDIYYIEHISLLTDIKMVFAVIVEVLKGAEYRAMAKRVPFLGDNLDDTHSIDDADVSVRNIRFDSINNSAALKK